MLLLFFCCLFLFSGIPVPSRSAPQIPVRGDGEEGSRGIPEICTAGLRKSVEWLCSAVCGDNRRGLQVNLLCFSCVCCSLFGVLLDSSDSLWCFRSPQGCRTPPARPAGPHVISNYLWNLSFLALFCSCGGPVPSRSTPQNPVRGDGEEGSKAIPEICTAGLYKPVEWLCNAVCGDNRRGLRLDFLFFSWILCSQSCVLPHNSDSPLEHALIRGCRPPPTRPAGPHVTPVYPRKPPLFAWQNEPISWQDRNKNVQFKSLRQQRKVWCAEAFCFFVRTKWI